MFRRREQHPNDVDGHRRFGFFSRGPRGPVPPHPVTRTTEYHNTFVGPNHPNAYIRDPYYQGSTRSDWDHYAVRHEEALIGDPLPVMNNGLNLAAQNYATGNNVGPYGTGVLANGPLNHGYDDTHYDKRHQVPRNFDRFGNPLIGPVTANGPLAGNYSSGTVVERHFLRGPGKRTRTGWVDDNTGGRQWGSTAWGAEPLYGTGQANSWGSQPLYGYRDARDTATPLLPENPWTHNELGRDYVDAYRRGTMAYSSVNNAFLNPPVTETFTTHGPNGELIQNTRTRVIKEEIVPPIGAIGTNATSTTTTIVKDEIIPVTNNHTHEEITIVQPVKVL